MTENSYLNPTDIKNQCSKATINLNKDNESIAVAEASMDLFINDSEIKGDAFDALKQQINDYKWLFKHFVLQTIQILLILIHSQIL